MNRKLLIVTALLASLAATTAQAEPSSRVAWTPETLTLVKKGNAVHGEELARNQGCDGCHAGEAMPQAPQLAGQLATYLYRQLHDYKDRSRVNDTMNALAASLSEQDMADIAAWYAEQSPQAGNKAPSGTTSAAQRLASQGDKQRLLTACAACHGAGGQGQAQDIPRLAGQKPTYLAATLLAYKNGQRHNDVYGRMRALAAPLSEDEIRQLADYYSALGR